MRMLEREMLERFGFGVTEANNGEQSLTILDEAPPDLVLLDVEMPGIDGFELCHRLRKRWDMTRVSVIMVTGMDDLKSINRAYDSGANDFVAKPINWPIFGHRARYVWRSALAARQLRAPDFLASVAATIAETGINTEQLELELTENILMEPESRQVQGL